MRSSIGPSKYATKKPPLQTIADPPQDSAAQLAHLATSGRIICFADLALLQLAEARTRRELCAVDAVSTVNAGVIANFALRVTGVA
ncbi:hypothetical protein [Granulicella tundricola]|uniref:Uncharacterized protein n=1 Tax=Granulicella tundricola (strain ATCC BAA-1859 / DSM 23138 / MP5ACTX9) TaxID=1198114 RepID=E8WVM1_GRATM|nr:hypothetical protein [Granulicella tundricola]ADW69550.1 hypothetical protein AciX9_2520 [Granulicella tundricola MP5ACTX9]